MKLMNLMKLPLAIVAITSAPLLAQANPGYSVKCAFYAQDQQQNGDCFAHITYCPRNSEVPTTDDVEAQNCRNKMSVTCEGDKVFYGGYDIDLEPNYFVFEGHTSQHYPVAPTIAIERWNEMNATRSVDAVLSLGELEREGECKVKPLSHRPTPGDASGLE